MLIMSPTEAAVGIGAKCGGSAPTNDDPGMVAALRYLTPRIEGALNVESLTRGVFVDSFFCSAMPYGQERPEQALRLSNGFLAPELTTVTAPDGTFISGADVKDINLDTGIVRLYSWQRGVYTVSYTSGFEVPALPAEPYPDGYDPEDRVLIGTPDWMKAIVIHLLVIWYRTAQTAPKASKDLSYGQIDTAIRRELYARIYEKYDRPRVAVTFSERMDRVS